MGEDIYIPNCTYSMEQFLLEKLTGSQLVKKLPHFMEPEI